MVFRYRPSDESAYWCSEVDAPASPNEILLEWYGSLGKSHLIVSEEGLFLATGDKPGYETMTPALPSWWWDEVEGKRTHAEGDFSGPPKERSATTRDPSWTKGRELEELRSRIKGDA